MSRLLVNSKLILGLTALATSFAVASQAHASLVFNFNIDPSITADFGASNAALIDKDMMAVGKTFSSQFTNNLTLNFTIKADPTPGALASSASTYTQDIGLSPFTYSQVRTALISNASTAASISATNSLPLNEPATATGGGYILTNAEAQALGLEASNPTLNDGTLLVGSNIGGGANFDFNGTSVPGALDYSFLDAAEHEVSELMGRTTQLNNIGFPLNEPIDLFRYTAPGKIDMRQSTTGVYFSTDGGVTDAKDYNPPNTDGADIQDWASSAKPDPYDAFGTPGTYANLTPVDGDIMNTLGWKSSSVSAVPLPPGLPMLGSAIMGLVGLRRWKSRRSSL